MIVVDASAITELLFQTEPGTRVERRLYRHDDGLHTTHLLDVEVLSALRRLVQAAGPGPLASTRRNSPYARPLAAMGMKLPGQADGRSLGTPKSYLTGMKRQRRFAVADLQVRPACWAERADCSGAFFQRFSKSGLFSELLSSSTPAASTIRLGLCALRASKASLMAGHSTRRIRSNALSPSTLLGAP